MATTVKQVVGARTSLTVTGLSTLASANYVVSNIYTSTTNQPLDVIVEVNAASTGIVTGNKQVVVFAQESLDGTSFRSGPISGTATTDEPNLLLLGILPLASSTSTETKTFSVASALGYTPPFFKVILKNDAGVSLTAGTVETAEISGSLV